MSQDWYKKHYAIIESPEFDEWWKSWHGLPSEYNDESEYWIRKGFALAGWIANED